MQKPTEKPAFQAAVKFIPGPWKTEQAQRPPHHLLVIGPRGQTVAIVFKRSETDDKQGIANAHLVEQAPTLFDLLACALDEYEQHNGRRVEGPHWSVEARDILDRCEGKR